ncbi:MAG TPA: ergothioneine biosynthesis protein EgtB [Acidimicrobiia bacterium]|nr:ergothioneine biosynthesis protein EgtB [Acidimicrobiia bacterium]
MGDLKQGLADALDGARRRSLGLLDPLSDEELLAQHSPLMSPLVWDLAHVGHYEELWLLRTVARTRPIDPAHDDVYDAFRHARRERAKLSILGPAEARRHVGMVRGRVLDVLDKVELDPAPSIAGSTPAPPGLLTDGFVYGMVAQHEHQHDETMLATLQLMASPYPHGGVPAPPGRALPAAEVLIPGGPFTMGTDAEPFAYDNERPAHVVDVGPFFIDSVPVTNRQYLAFVEAGGYDEPRFWADAGWAQRTEAGLVAPQFWRSEGGRSWSVLRYGRRLDLPLDEPVQHVSWYEADAYARFAGRRLPTEAEWEKAATGASPLSANLGQRHFGPAPVGAYPDGASVYGVEQMIGDVWEWTSSDFTAYPGFVTFPYKEYSEVFYGSDYKVLRGGSWATSPLVARATFRNWDYPIRRQIFAGFRCARDV